MSRLIPAAERLVRARKLIQKAREVPPTVEAGMLDLTYIAGVKDLLQQARDLVKFIPYSPSTSPEMKEEVAQINLEADQAAKELLHKGRSVV
ncbi:MAG TPA: hypothetical protein VGJ97_10735 [Anaerolineaceae bacterium]